MAGPCNRGASAHALATESRRSMKRSRIAALAISGSVGLAALGVVTLYVVATVRSIYAPVYRGDPHPVSREQAEAARNAAYAHKLVVEATEAGLAACATQDWDLCRTRLNEATHDEPAVARDPRVIKARMAYTAAMDKALLESAPSRGW